jgi:hypothetical protein
VRTLNIDTIIPSISFVSPTETNGTTISRNNIYINITASDNYGLKNITIFLFNTTGIINRSDTTASQLYRNYLDLPSGIYYFNATAYDNASNVNFTLTMSVTLLPLCNYTDVVISIWNFLQGKYISGIGQGDCELSSTNSSIGDNIWAYSNGRWVDGIGESNVQTIPDGTIVGNCNLTDIAISMWCNRDNKFITGIGTGGGGETPVNSTIGEYVWQWITRGKWINGISSNYIVYF